MSTGIYTSLSRIIGVVYVSSAHPNPREVWAAAISGRRVRVAVKTDSRSVHSGRGSVRLTGTITEREKTGDAWNTNVTIRFTPDGELAPVEMEATKRGGEWEAFRVFEWRSASSGGRDDSRYRYVGEVVDVEFTGVQLARDRDADSEVSA